jgi:hypothetical protein
MRSLLAVAVIAVAVLGCSTTEVAKPASPPPAQVEVVTPPPPPAKVIVVPNSN